MQTSMSEPKGAHQLDMRTYAFEPFEDAPAG